MPRASLKNLQQRHLLYLAIQTYALETAGTSDDLDGQMEAAAIEHLLAQVGDGLQIAQDLP